MSQSAIVSLEMPLDDAYTTTATGVRASEQPVFPMPESAPEISTSKIGWGGPRANSGGARPNSGGPRPNSGGARPGAGRPRKATVPAYTPDLPEWRVVATFGQAEIAAIRELTRQGYETYLPLIAIRRRDPVVASMWHEVRVPLFPGYGFVRLTQHESREPVAATHGVRELLHRADGRLATVPAQTIDRLRDGEEERLRLPKARGDVLAIGTEVSVESGAFSGHSGKVLQCDGIRTQVELVLFSRPTPVWLDRVMVVV